MAAIARDQPVGLSYEKFKLPLKLTYPEKVVGAPTHFNATFVVVWNWPAKTGQAYLETVDESSGSSTALPITLHFAGIVGEKSFVGGNATTNIPFPHSIVSPYRVWVIENEKDNTIYASISSGKDPKKEFF